MEERIAETKNPEPWGDDVNQTFILLNDTENVEHEQQDSEKQEIKPSIGDTVNNGDENMI